MDVVGWQRACIVDAILAPNLTSNRIWFVYAYVQAVRSVTHLICVVVQSSRGQRPRFFFLAFPSLFLPALSFSVDFVACVSQPAERVC